MVFMSSCIGQKESHVAKRFEIIEKLSLVWPG